MFSIKSFGRFVVHAILYKPIDYSSTFRAECFCRQVCSSTRIYCEINAANLVVLSDKVFLTCVSAYKCFFKDQYYSICFPQEGFARLWRGTNAGLALAVPTVSSLMN